MSNYLTSLVRRGAGLPPKAGGPPTIVPRRVPEWMLAGPVGPADAPGFQADSATIDVPAAVDPAGAVREPMPPPNDPEGARWPVSPAFTAGEVATVAPEMRTTTTSRAPIRLASESEPDRAPLRTEVPRAEPTAETIPPRHAGPRDEAIAPVAGPIPPRSAAEGEPTARAVRIVPPSAVMPHRTEPEPPSILPVRSGAPAATLRLVPVEPDAEAVEPPAAISVTRPPRADEPAPAAVLDRPRALAQPPQWRPAAAARSAEDRTEAIREQRVTVRIGAIEIRVPEPRRPPEEPPSAPASAPPVPAPSGFDAYARLRTYAPWGLGDRP